jgi:hypothetical protein
MDEAQDLYQAMRADAVRDYERDRAVERATVLEAKLQYAERIAGCVFILLVLVAALFAGCLWGAR